MHPLNPESPGYGYQRFVEMYKYIFLFLLRIQLTATFTSFFLFVIRGTARLLSWCCEIHEMYLVRLTSAGSCASIRCELQVTHFTSTSKGQGDSGKQGRRGRNRRLGAGWWQPQHGTGQRWAGEASRAMGVSAGRGLQSTNREKS